MPAKFTRGAAGDELARRFGGYFRTEDASVSVGTSIVEVQAANAERVSLTMVNLGTTVLYVRPNSAPSTSAGIRLGPSGGAITLNVTDDGMLPCEQWLAIGDAAGGTLYRLSTSREQVSGPGGWKE